MPQLPHFQKGCAAQTTATYPITITNAGDYKVWVGRYSIGSSQNLVFADIDRMLLGGTHMDNLNIGLNPPEWVWIGNGPTIHLDAGTYTLQVRRRQEQYNLDRIYLTMNGDTPTGTGPPESAFE